jgi:hypothetical protein
MYPFFIEKVGLMKKSCIFAGKKIMATITLEYNSRNSVANRIIAIIIAMDNVFKVKTHVTKINSTLTRKAIQDAEAGNVITCDSFEDYLQQTAQYV